jgi:acetyltransferase-like isoleucine patch superfamily enzyme
MSGKMQNIVQWLNRILQTKLWGMDIHPTATIEANALIDRTWPRGIHIGADCYVCDEAVILTHDRTRGLYLDTRLEPRCYVGHRAIIMPGLSVGEDSVVLAGAVVTKDMPPRSQASGNPAVVTARTD